MANSNRYTITSDGLKVGTRSLFKTATFWYATLGFVAAIYPAAIELAFDPSNKNNWLQLGASAFSYVGILISKMSTNDDIKKGAVNLITTPHQLPGMDDSNLINVTDDIDIAKKIRARKTLLGKN